MLNLKYFSKEYLLAPSKIGFLYFGLLFIADITAYMIIDSIKCNPLKFRVYWDADLSYFPKGLIAKRTREDNEQ
ncbi:unnamed protein product [Blepharisma stoltei]|uniref:Uncharacterized protein n=1 Tax=Blepharisma stoltei TaxID=1481888 RepID=A0AAU9J069_9CILI|nr:unnamed protein product [Blepharisma stoltei]